MMIPSVLITGASNGIGLELARIMARGGGYALLLVARSEDKLLALKQELEADYGARVEVCVQDLSQSGAAEAVYTFACECDMAVDVLINNAGFADFSPFADSELARQEDMLQVNIVALTSLTRLFLPQMVQRRRGYILNLGSIASFTPGPLMAVYFATKAFVLSFTEALAVELEGSGVQVTALCPGATATGFEQAAKLESSMLFQRMKPASARDVAEYGYRAMRRGKTVAVAGWGNKLLVTAAKLAPRRLVRNMVYRMMK